MPEYFHAAYVFGCKINNAISAKKPKYTFLLVTSVYASRPHKHIKIDFTPKLSSQQHVKYGSYLMNIFFLHFNGVLGKQAYVESRGTKVS